MSAATVTNLIDGLRLATLVLCGSVAYWGAGAGWRVAGAALRLTPPAGKLDWMSAGVAVLASGVVAFQVRSLMGAVPPRTDAGTALALAPILIGALGVIYAHALYAPEGHRRAVMAAHLAIAVVCILLGATM